MSIVPIELFDEKTNSAIPFDFSRIVWCEPEEGTFGEGKQKMTYYRLNAKVKNPDGTEGPFVVHFGKHNSFGIQKTTDPADETKHTGYACNFCLHTYNNGSIVPTEFDKVCEQFCLDLQNYMKDYVLEVKSKIGKPKLVREQLEKLKVIRYPEDKKTGERIANTSPMLNTKLICSKKTGTPKIVSKFYLEDQVDKDGNLVELDPLTLEEKRNTMDSYVLISGIYVGSDIYSQIKLWEAHLTPYVSSGLRTLKPAPKVRVTFNADDSKFKSFVKGSVDSKEDLREKIHNNIPSDDDDDENGTSNPLSLNPPVVTAQPEQEAEKRKKRKHKRDTSEAP